MLDRLRLVFASVAITLLVFSQSSGMVAADTKLDLVVDPARFLHRAMTLWDSEGSAGQLQDQAYGYLFPMGPFFLLGKLLALPPEVIQRSWESAILVVAFLGARRLASLLGVPGFWPAMTAGLVYALAPRMLTELFSISSELLPVAVLPLVLIPLVKGSTAGSTRSAAMRSGAALLLAGGINASATLAILPVPALWLLTRSRGPRRASLIRWWALAVVLACSWWFLPLVVLGRYSPPFLNWIESSSVTTSQNSFIAVARGADHWQAYLGPNIWPAGWIFAVGAGAIVATALVAAVGFAGLALPRLPHRLFLVSTVVLGFLVLTLGHSAAIGGPAAGTMRTLLDTQLSAFRNIHKFDPLVRLPLALGVGQLAGRAIPVTKSLSHKLPAGRRWIAPFVATTAACCLAAIAIAPALTSQLVQQPRSTAMADYWPQAASWLSQHSAQGRALVIPGAGRPEMYWGSTIDEPMQAVAESPWTSRDTVPLGQAGYVRLLDEIEFLIAGGTPQPTLAPVLARAGIGYLVIRADLVPTADATDIGIVRSTVLGSPGLSTVQSFGPAMRVTGASNRVIDSGLGNNVAAIQILAVDGGAGRVDVVDADHAVVANGSADELPALIAAGLQPHTPVLFGADASAAGVSDPVRVLTDGLRKREVPFGSPAPLVATMTADQPYQITRVAHDYLPDNAGALSSMQYQGIADVRASSSGSDVGAFLNRGPEYAPWYALDGDPDTAWLSGSADGAVGQWFETRFLSPVTDPEVTIQFASQVSDFPTALTVGTSTGSTRVSVTPDARPQRLNIPRGTTQLLRLTVASLASGTKGVGVGLATVSVAGVQPQRSLEVPGVSSPDVLAFRAAAGARTGCVAVGSSSACVPRLARTGEEQLALARSLTLSDSSSYRVSAAVVLTPGSNLDARLDDGSGVAVTASTTASTDPRQRPGAVVDGVAGTTWSASATDRKPTLSLRLAAPAQLSSLTLRTSPDAPVSVPSEVRVSVAGHSWNLTVSDSGTIELPRTVLAQSLQLQILRSAIRVTYDPVTGAAEILPTGVSELSLSRVSLPASASKLVVPCGQGPELDVDGRVIQTSVTASRTAVLTGAEVPATLCGSASLSLAAGSHAITLIGSSAATALGLTLTRGSPLSATNSAPASARVLGWHDTTRTVSVTATNRCFLVVHENFNAGWHASLGGHPLAAVRIDGWQQAFVLPAGSTGTVSISFAPDRVFKGGLLLGLVAALLLLLLSIGLSGRLLRRGRIDVPDPASLADGRLAYPLTAVGVVLQLTLLAGPTGLAASVMLLIITGWRRPPARWSRWSPLLAGAAVAVAGVLNAVGPSVSSHSLTDSAVVQGLVMLALLVLIVPLVGRFPVERSFVDRPLVGKSPPDRLAR